MEMIIPFAVIALVATGIGAAFRRRSAPAIRRTSWALLLRRCLDKDILRPATCPMRRDFREGKMECSRCGCTVRGATIPLSEHHAYHGDIGLQYEPSGPLISSLCEDAWRPQRDFRHPDYRKPPAGDRHAPLFDLDYAAELLDDGARGHVLVLHKDTEVAHAHAVIEALEACGIASQGAAKSFSDQFVFRLEEGLGTIRISNRSVSIAIPLVVPARLVPSSSPGHHHLYLETVLTWSVYNELLRRMADAELIERNWHAMCERRKMGLLRKPGIGK